MDYKTPDKLFLSLIKDSLSEKMSKLKKEEILNLSIYQEENYRKNNKIGDQGIDNQWNLYLYNKNKWVKCKNSKILTYNIRYYG